MKTRRILFPLVMFLAIASCAPLNPKLNHYDYRQGYRFGNCATPGNSDDLFIVLTFSGGGTRAAAFSYGVLKTLNETNVVLDGARRKLIDEVDVISSISGGSFTAAYYGLFGQRLFADFETRFLKHNVQGDLIMRTLYPWNWFKLLSPYYSRIDIAAAYYDDRLFEKRTYNDLVRAGRRPFIMLNATDLSLGTRFEFSQGQFDLLQSDLGGVSIGRAVAASSAFPGLLTPVTLKNYPKTDFVEPQWVQTVIKNDLDNSPRRFKRASEVGAYFDTQREYIHLMDGGVADNIGLRGTLYGLMFPDELISGDLEFITDSREYNLIRMIANRKIRKLLIIVVDAKPGDNLSMDHSRKTPGLAKVVNSVASAPMANYSFETVQLLTDYMEQRYPDPEKLKTYVVHLRFDSIKDPVQRKRVKSYGTNFDLPPEAVDELITVGAMLLKQSEVFTDEFLKDLGTAQK